MLHHIAFWTGDLDRLVDFYTTHWGGKILRAHATDFKRSAFLEVFSSVRLELMERNGLQMASQEVAIGYAHMAVEVESEKRVEELTRYCKSQGIPLLVECVHYDGGFYESAFQDPDGNVIELTFMDRSVSPLL